MIKRTTSRNAYLAVIILSAVLILYSYPGISAEQQEKPQKMCPVMGAKIDKSVYTDHEGNRIYFCCAACIDTFKKDPEGYMKKMKADGIAFEKISQGKSQCKNKEKGDEKHQCTRSDHGSSQHK